jgi:hypothetical protein
MQRKARKRKRRRWKKMMNERRQNADHHRPEAESAPARSPWLQASPTNMVNKKMRMMTLIMQKMMRHREPDLLLWILFRMRMLMHH